MTWNPLRGSIDLEGAYCGAIVRYPLPVSSIGFVGWAICSFEAVSSMLLVDQKDNALLGVDQTITVLVPPRVLSTADWRRQLASSGRSYKTMRIRRFGRAIVTIATAIACYALARAKGMLSGRS